MAGQRTTLFQKLSEHEALELLEKPRSAKSEPKPLERRRARILPLNMTSHLDRTKPASHIEIKERRRHMSQTYRAIEVTKPGTLTLVERPLPEPGPTEVRIRVEASGVCHTDAAVVEGLWPDKVSYPRVPGHEIVGRVEAVGARVTRVAVGQRVGVGWFGGECGTCESCRRGDTVNCANLIVPGVTRDGGWAEVALAEERALAIVPAGVNPIDAAPLMCAGVTTFNALRNAGWRPGDTVAIQGIGGLGHLGVQFARRMGFHTIAVGRGRDKEPLARELGAHDYVDTVAEDGAQALQKLGGAHAILTTATSGKAMAEVMGGLKARGTLIVVGASPDSINVDPGTLLFGARRVQGEIVGTPIDSEDTLKFSARQGVRPMTERMPLERAPEAYARMMRNEARFRMVLSFA
jgi:D-arabinose 1-dehydrogenase-like Zn-dependent alcohol dehydrogenase